jgi:hypothetical protein
VGSSSQPSHRSSSAPVQSVASRAQIRSTISAGSAITDLRGDELAGLGADAVEQLRERLGELVHALALERVRDVVDVDPGLGEAREDGLRLLDPLLERERDLAVVLEARIVSSGIVLTVSGPISSST